MTPRRSPVLAQTLLEWVDPANDALHGDLLEEFAAGRSRPWYWRQVIGAAGGDHRVVRVVGFGVTTMLCAIVGLQAVSVDAVPGFILPVFYQQVSTTAAFIAGLLGGVGAALMVKPRTAPLALTDPTPVSL